MLELLFYAFAFSLVIASLCVICASNTVHRVLFLIFAFFNASGIFIMLGAEFIAMTLVIVYVGAVAVLFLFVVMMLNINASEYKKSATKHAVLSVLLACCVFAQVALALINSGELMPSKRYDENYYQNNTLEIGKVLYTDYVVEFQIAGLILLSAMIGAIFLALKNNVSSISKSQNVFEQMQRNKQNSVQTVKVKIGEGVSV